MRSKWLGAALAVMAAAALAPLSASARTSSDNFAAAGTVSAADEVRGDTSGNTVEPGEPQPCGMIGATAWYRLEGAPGTPVTLHTAGSDFDTVLAVYTGTSLADLSLVDCNDDFGGWSSRVRLTLGEGAYWVQLGGFGGKAGPFVLSSGSSPANDDMADAQDASAGFDGVISTEGAGGESGEPRACDLSTYASVWYRVDAPVETDVVVALDDYTDEWTLGLYEQRPEGTLEELACDYGYDGPGFSVRAAARPGTPLYVRAASWQAGETGRLRILPLHLPEHRHPHDTAATAKVIGSMPFADETSTMTATSVGEPDSCSLNTGTVWYRFSPALPTPVVAHAVGSDFDTVIGVFRQDGDVLTQVACNDDATPWGAAGSESLVRFVAEPGRTYLFQVGGFDGRSGQLAFEVYGAAR